MQSPMSGKPLSKSFWAYHNFQTGGDMWAILRQEEIRRITKREFNNGGVKIKKEEEDVAIASKGQRKQGKKKKDLSKVQCFRDDELGNFANTCPKRKDKEALDSKAATAKGDDGSEDVVAMSAHVPREKRWGDIVM